jgi:ribosomal protein S12 methylthiotransferase accessory factor
MGVRVWFPPAFYIPYRPISDREVTIGPSISTGLACGADRSRAILGGLYEAIERDAFTIAWRNRLGARRLVLDEPGTVHIFERYFARPRLNYHLFHIAFDIAVPTVVAIVEDCNFDPPLFCLGGAARLSATEAVRKALIECAQGWTWARQERVQHGTMERPANFSHITTFDDRVTLYACANMGDALDFLLNTELEVSLAALVAQSGPCDHPISRLVGEIAGAGSDAIVIDLTTCDIADLGPCVVKCFCPQLAQVEGDYRFPLLGGRRWRFVPVEMGWRKEALHFADLNPFPHPYP